ncbi:hypothetical protein BVRB_4g074470 [Beta vulgaris subsp. vulgaris]|nr:hypothetical protein BVRB_4g074470 [Beta vulgaris subsp. vulgaris]
MEVASSEPSLEPPNLPSQANNPSLHESDFHTNPPMSFSRGSPASVTQNLSPAISGHEVLSPPGRRFSTDVNTSGHIEDFVSPRPQHVPTVSTAISHPSLIVPTAAAQIHRSRPFYRHLGITTRPPKLFRVAVEHEECYVPPTDDASGFIHQSPGWDSLSNVGTLEALVEQGRTTSGSPHPDEPGPSTWFFDGHKRSAEDGLHSQSANDIAGLPLEVSYRSHAGKRQRLEQWEAKGGFNLGFLRGDVRTKAITDVSMARNLEVEPGEEIMSSLAKKRHAATSPPMTAKKWIFKRQRGNDVSSTATDMEGHFSLLVKVSTASDQVQDEAIDLVLRDLNLPHLSPSSQQQLIRPFSQDEVHEAMIGIGQGKSPGMDGSTAEFFKLYWVALGNEGAKLPSRGLCQI